MIHNGADDDGSGSVSLLEIAEAFQEAAAAGQGTQKIHSIPARYWRRKRTAWLCLLRQ